MSRILGWQMAVPRLRVPSLSRGRRSSTSASQRSAQARRPPLLTCVAAVVLDSPARLKPQPPTPDSVGLRPALSPRFWLEPSDHATIDGPNSTSSVRADPQVKYPLAELPMDCSCFIAASHRQEETCLSKADVGPSSKAIGGVMLCEDSSSRVVQCFTPTHESAAKCDAWLQSCHNENEVLSEGVQLRAVNSATSTQGSSQCQSTQFFCIADGDDDEAEYEYFPALPALGSDTEDIKDLADEIEASSDAGMFDAGEGAETVQWLAKVVLTAIDSSPHRSEEVSTLPFEDSVRSKVSALKVPSDMPSEQSLENACGSAPSSADVRHGVSSSPSRAGEQPRHSEARQNPLIRNETRPLHTSLRAQSESLFPLLSPPRADHPGGLGGHESGHEDGTASEGGQLLSMVPPAWRDKLSATPHAPSAGLAPSQHEEGRRNPLTGKPSRLRAVPAVPKAPVPSLPSATLHPAPSNSSAADTAATPVAQKPTLVIAQDPAAVPKRREAPGLAQRKLLSPLPPTPVASALMQSTPFAPGARLSPAPTSAALAEC